MNKETTTGIHNLYLKHDIHKYIHGETHNGRRNTWRHNDIPKERNNEHINTYI